jgi:hypothetical protein
MACYQSIRKNCREYQVVIYKVEGANHLEITDMSNSPQGDITETRFNQIWNRGTDDFFHTERR